MNDFRSQTQSTRGIRNNNPFNVIITPDKWKGKVKGKDTKFETFDSIENGIRAGIIDIVGDICKDKDNTISKLIEKFAPRTENNTTAYITFLAGQTGKKADEILTDKNGQIDFNLLVKLAVGIIRKENGTEAGKISQKMILEGVLLGASAPQVKKYVSNFPTQLEPTGKNPIQKDKSGIIIMLVFFAIIILSQI